VGEIVFDRYGPGGLEEAYVGTYLLAAGHDSAERQVPIDLAVDGLVPIWSPDGTRLAISYFIPTALQGGVAVIAPDGSGFTPVEPQERFGVPGPGCNDWARDGLSLLCGVPGWESFELSGIYLIGLDRKVTRLTSSTNPTVEKPGGACGGGDGHPAFSADGRSLLFVRTRCGDGADPSSDQSAQLVVANADGSDQTVILPYGVPNSHGGGKARWSPDGSRILYGSEDGRLWQVSPDGSDVTEIEHALSDGRTHAFAPSWSPDGEWIIFSMFVPQLGRTELYVVRPDGSQLTRITDDRGTETFASWRP
jgi:Tol biopolymer transport system component